MFQYLANFITAVERYIKDIKYIVVQAKSNTSQDEEYSMIYVINSLAVGHLKENSVDSIEC